jgi:TatD DNase family protein
LYLAIDKVVEEAKENGVAKIIAVAMSVQSQKRILELATNYTEIFPALGIHPEEVKMNVKILDELPSVVELINDNKKDICAIGEIGLDHHFIKDEKTYPIQLKVFTRMLDVAHTLNLPVNLHTKGAESEVFELLPSFTLPAVNIHWYSGPEKFLRIGMDRGYYFSITPAVSYSPAVKKTVEMVDLEHLLVESDGPVKYSGQIGVPAMIKNVIGTIADLKSQTTETIASQLYENTTKVFPKAF